MKTLAFLTSLMSLCFFYSCIQNELNTDIYSKDSQSHVSGSNGSTSYWHSSGYCNSNYADAYILFDDDTEVIRNFGELGYWHNALLDYAFEQRNRLDNISSLTSSSFDTMRQVMKEGIILNSPNIDKYINPENIYGNSAIEIELYGLLETLGTLSYDDVDVLVDFGKSKVDSIYEMGFLDIHSRNVLFSLLDDYADNDNVVDFQAAYDSLNVFYDSTSFSSKIALSVLAISEYSYCYWDDFISSGITPRIFHILVGVAVADCLGVISNTWYNLGKKVINQDWTDFTDEELCDIVIGGAVTGSMFGWL